MSLLGSLQPQPRQHAKKKKKPHPLIVLEKNMPEKLKILFVWPYKVSAFLYYVAIVVSTFFVPLAGVEYISWSEIYKYVGVSIVVGHYCELNSHMTGLIYVLLTNRRSKKQEKQAQNFSEY